MHAKRETLEILDHVLKIRYSYRTIRIGCCRTELPVNRFTSGSRFVDVVNVTTHYTCVGTTNATLILVASIATI